MIPLGIPNWRNTNNHVGSDTMYISLGLNRAEGGVGPTLFSYGKLTDEVLNLGPLFDPSSAFSYGSGEGWYFSASRPTTMYVFLTGTAQLGRFDVLRKSFESNPAMDLAQCPKPSVCAAEGMFITQPHSSDDDLVHSATVQNESWDRIGCVVYREDTAQFQYFPRVGAFDECHVDKSGRWLMSLENTVGGGWERRMDQSCERHGDGELHK